MKYKYSEDQFGFMSFYDKRGATSKVIRNKQIHSQLSQAVNKIKPLLTAMNLSLVTNPSTIVTDSQYPKLIAILEKSKLMWQEVDFPYITDLHIRTATFSPTTVFSLPNAEMPITEGEAFGRSTQKFIKDILHSPDQVLIHPRPNLEYLLENLINVRFSQFAGISKTEFGIGGIKDVNQIELADFQVSFEEAEERTMTIFKGIFTNNEQQALLEKLVIAGNLIVPFLTQYVVPTNKRLGNIVFECQVLPYPGQSGRYVIIFMDYETL